MEMSNNAVRVLIIMGGFFPGRKYGGPPVSTDNFCSLLKGDAECFIVTRDHDLGEDEPYQNITAGWNNRGNVKVKYVSDCNYKSATFKAIIKEIAPIIIM